MALIPISGPAEEPVSLEEIKDYLHVDFDEDDASLRAFITAARLKIEQRCQRAFSPQQWEYRVPEFADSIEIPMRPTIDVDAVKYLDADGVEQDVDPAAYAFVLGGDDASQIIRLRTWPTTAQRPDAVRIRFTAGYPSDESPEDPAGDVPETIKQAIRWLVGHFYDNRESVQILRSSQEYREIPDSVQAIIAPYIVPRL